MILGLCAVFLCSMAVMARHGGDEPECPKFYYEEKTLEKLVRLEHKVELQEKDLRKREVTLENTLATIDDKTQTMRELMEKLGEKMTDTETSMAEKASEWDQTFKEKLESYKRSVQSTLENCKVPTVVFKAKTVPNTYIAKGTVFVFTEPIINHGNGYDVTTGYFSAPVSGTYMFTSQLCCTDSQWVHANIVANGVATESTSHHGTDGSGTCMTFTGVAVLSKGEMACVQGSWNNGRIIENSHRWATFAGILVNTA